MSNGSNTPLSERLNQKSIQLKDQQDIEQASQKLRVPTREKGEEPMMKKKRKLLSFQDQIDEPMEKIQKNTQMKPVNQKKVIAKSGNIEDQLKEEYQQQAERMKEELIQFEYSYWDQANVVKKLRRKKKQTIRELLQVCRLELISNNQSLISVEPSDLLFVIKDFIAPHEIAIFEIEALGLKTSKNDLLLNLKNIKIKKQNKEIPLSVNLDGPIRIIEKARYEKNKAAYPFLNWWTLNIKSK